MFEVHSITNYGINDIATGHYIKKLVEDLKNEVFIERFLLVLESDIDNLEKYEALLKAKVILEYREFLTYLSSQEIKDKLNDFYSLLSNKKVNKNRLIGKIISHINQNPSKIFSESTYEIKKESIKLVIKYSGGVKVWGEIINYTSTYLLNSHYDELYQVLHKKFKTELVLMTNKILFPLSFKDYERQIEIALRIKHNLPELYSDFQSGIFQVIETNGFERLDNSEQVRFMKETLNSRILGIEGEILIQDKLEKAEKILEDLLMANGFEYEINSRQYAEIESRYSNFQDKFYLLTFIESLSLYRLMQYEEKDNLSILDFVSYENGIKHEKYGKASFAIVFKNFLMTICVNTIHLVKNYGDEFWNELISLSEKVALFTGISNFLGSDLNLVKKLAQEEEYFLACTFTTQLIERLLRELFLKLTYGESGIFNEANFTLGNLLNYKVGAEANKLMLIFSKEEIETMDYFLINKEYGLNLRNRLAHYNIKTKDININNFMYLIHILIFILIKVEYQGTVFERSNITSR